MDIILVGMVALGAILVLVVSDIIANQYRTALDREKRTARYDFTMERD